jgi:hypothetical protein
MKNNVDLSTTRHHGGYLVQEKHPSIRQSCRRVMCGLAALLVLAEPAHTSTLSDLTGINIDGDVEIVNTNQSANVNFRISGKSCRPPLDTYLKPDSQGSFNCPGESEFNFLVVTSMADGSRVERSATLLGSHRYEIYNDDSGVWNIREVLAR